MLWVCRHIAEASVWLEKSQTEPAQVAGDGGGAAPPLLDLRLQGGHLLYDLCEGGVHAM